MGSTDHLAPTFGNDPIFEVCAGVHYVEGPISLPPLNMISFPRGMAILSTAAGTPENELVLVNPMRLSDSGEAELLRLGRVHSVVQIGLHERDMEYYVVKFGAKAYGLGGKVYKEMAGAGAPFTGKRDFDLAAGDLPPVPGLRVVTFPCLPPTLKECALLVADKVLITCDSIQCHEEPRGNWITRVCAPFFGFKGKVIIGPIWMKAAIEMIGERGKEKIGKDLLQLTKLPHEFLLSGHGYITDGSGKEALDHTLCATFGDPN